MDANTRNYCEQKNGAEHLKFLIIICLVLPKTFMSKNFQCHMQIERG